MLLQNGADVNIKDNSGQIPINKINSHNEEIWIDLIEAGSEHMVKEKGHLRSEGKDYIIRKGDIVKYLFNV